MTLRTLRALLPCLLPLLAGCATGYAQDWFKGRSNIITPQLLRYGLDLQQSRCVAERLGRRLSRSDLARLQERAAAVQPVGPSPLTFANLRAAATQAGGRAVEGELTSSAEACSVPLVTAGAETVTAPVTAPAPAPVDVAALTPGRPVVGDLPPPSGAAEAAPASAVRGGEVSSTAAVSQGAGGVEAGAAWGDNRPDAAASSGAAMATWLNLGAAASGQSIAVDAASILQDGATRTAWFRMTDVQTGARTGNAYRLKIDCTARTVAPLAMRQVNQSGAVTSMRVYDATEAVPGPAESGTVLEIAYLSLCT